MKRLRRFLWRMGMFLCRRGLHAYAIRSWQEPYRVYFPVEFRGVAMSRRTYRVRTITGLRCKRCAAPKMITRVSV